jgi:hypothetical protein
VGILVLVCIVAERSCAPRHAPRPDAGPARRLIQ